MKKSSSTESSKFTSPHRSLSEPIGQLRRQLRGQLLGAELAEIDGLVQEILAEAAD